MCEKNKLLFSYKKNIDGTMATLYKYLCVCGWVSVCVLEKLSFYEIYTTLI